MVKIISYINNTLEIDPSDVYTFALDAKRPNREVALIGPWYLDDLSGLDKGVVVIYEPAGASQKDVLEAFRKEWVS